MAAVVADSPCSSPVLGAVSLCLPGDPQTEEQPGWGEVDHLSGWAGSVSTLNDCSSL